ncbi:MAG: abortive infection family protein [Phycisphaerae bacterium]|nr:abortive infection family protein [Phycisphaerae bacterium]
MVSAAQQLLEKVEALRNMLSSHATGGGADESQFRSLRNELVKNPLIKDRLPRFVRTCRTLEDFWGFIKPKFAHYSERRSYLLEEFAPVLDFLEQLNTAPSDEASNAVLAKVDAPHVITAWQKALERRETDPEGAITAARTLLETVCKHILDDIGASYDDKADLPDIYRRTARVLNLAPDQHTQAVFRQILGGCTAVVEGLGALRNRLSDAHGRGKRATRPLSRHAGLAVNLAGTVASFLMETWEARNAESSGPRAGG